jgi:dimethylamine monooxygenase subunit A
MIHTPYDGSSKPFTIGLQQLDPTTWIEMDDQREVYLAEKRRLYRDETANVLVAEQGTETAQQEVLDLVVGHLEMYFPTLPRHPGEGRGPALVEALGLEVKRVPGLCRDDGVTGSAIATAGLLIQEDLVLMRKSAAGWRLVAASLCFPSAWNLLEKFGKPMHEIHQPVPGFGEGTRNAGLIDRMFDNLRVEQPVIRWNWSLYGDAKLYHPASDNKMKNRFGEGEITGRVFMRLERQTLRKLPKSGDILFTIRIHTNPLEVLQTHPDGPDLAEAIADQIESLTEQELDYKGLTGERAKLIARLNQIAVRSASA